MKYSIKILVLFFILLLLCSSKLSPQEENAAEEKSIIEIINKFSDEDPYVNDEAIVEVVKLGDKAVDYLIRSLMDGNENVRWCSSIALGKIAPEGERAIPFLTQALKDSNSNVRWCAAIALGKFNQAADHAIPELQKLLNDDDQDIRWASYIAIRKIDPDFDFKPPSLSDVVSIIDSLVPLLMNDYRVPGVSIALITNCEIAFAKSFGVKDLRTSTLVTGETMFEACSMSKPVFAYLVLKFAEQNKIDLDKPLYNYLDESFYIDDSLCKLVTARMILSHTSGLPNWRKGEEERNGPLPIYFTPGERFSYSGEGYYYLQRVVEKITGKALEEYASENLFQPLGLRHTSFVWTEGFDSLISCGHDTSGNYLAKSKYTHSNSAYTLYTTAEDYARFIIEILKTDRSSSYSLSKTTLEEMLKPQIDVLVRDPIERPGRALGLFVYWGLGWAIDSTASGRIYYHSGANRTGFRCYSQFRLHEGSGIVIMTNGLNGSELWRRMIKVIGDL